MADENLTRWEREWLAKMPDDSGTRSYGPVSGPDEPGVAPPGLPSASAPAGAPGGTGDERSDGSPDRLQADGGQDE